MRYTMGELTALTGLTARTIRSYIQLGYLAPPEGRGPGASYGEEQMLRVVALARMRARGDGWDVVAESLRTWSVAKLRAFVRKTEPAAPRQAASDEAANERSLEDQPLVRGLLPEPSRGSPAPLARRSPLAGGAELVMASVVPGVVLLVNRDADPRARRIAEEILENYRAK